MKIKHLLSLFALSLCISSASAQTAQRFAATKANDYGIAYTLPRTVVDVTIEAAITSRQPGEFYKYAKKYLNADNPITEPSVSATVKSVTIATHGTPDTDERYLVTLKSGFSPFINISPDNIPLGINTEDVYDAPAVTLPVATDAEPTPLQTAAARQVITEDMMRSHSTAKRAELAAEQIYALRQSRTDLITGQANQMPPDGQALQLILDNIDAQEKALVAMFLGTESTRTTVRTISIEPDDDISGRIIARLSPIDGIVPPADLSGAPITLSLTVTQRGEIPVNDKGQPIPMPKNGVPYCIPGSAEVTVDYDGHQVASADVEIAQFGVVYAMNPASFTDKKSPVYIIFNPSTGAISQTGPASLAR